MAGQARREHRAQGRSPRGDSSWAVSATPSADESGSAIATTTEPASPPSTAEPRTRSTYRNLLMRGLAPDEAANVTAYLAGIAVGETHWTLRQVNQLLFLRQMHRTGHFDEPRDPRAT
jgi:hypothetical protein